MTADDMNKINRKKRADVLAELPDVPATVSHIIDYLGGATEVARFLNIRQANVSNWKTNGGDGKGMIPAMYIGALCRMSEDIGVIEIVNADVIVGICDRYSDQPDRS